MKKLFNKILVPVDFTSSQGAVIKKAIDLAKEYNCSICLLHVETISAFSTIPMPGGHTMMPAVYLDNKKELEFQLKKIATEIQEKDIEVDYAIINGSWTQAIIDLIEVENFDIVLIGQRKFLSKQKMLINPDMIAARTNVPVITVPSNRRVTNLYSIVIPITDFLPVRKLMYGVYIASSYKTTVKLLGIDNMRTHERMPHYLNRAYSLIKDYSDVPVVQQRVESENVADAVNQYAREYAADLIIVNPGPQSKMPGFLSKLMGQILQRYALPPVLTVNPV